MFSALECLKLALSFLDRSWVQWCVQHPWSELCVTSITLQPMKTHASRSMKVGEKRSHRRTVSSLSLRALHLPISMSYDILAPNGRCYKLCEAWSLRLVAHHLTHAMHVCLIRCLEFGKREVYVESMLMCCIGARNFNNVRLKKNVGKTEATWHGGTNMGMSRKKLGLKSGSYHYHTM